MEVLLLPEAAQEFEDAVVYLEEEEPGLGGRFRAELDSHVRWIALNPTIPRLRDGVYRRVNLQVFPYYIAYLIKNESVWILAIAHGHRRPDYWIEQRTPNGHPDGGINSESLRSSP
jgi:plasmid stabilization system protein ParE